MKIACRCGTASPSAMSAVLSMPPVYRVGRNGPLRVPDGCDGCDGCGRTLPGITEPARKGGNGRRRVRRWRGLRAPRGSAGARSACSEFAAYGAEPFRHRRDACDDADRTTGRRRRAGMSREREIRVSDRERQAAAERLRAAHDEGRLDFSEYDRRLADAYSSVNYADLHKLFVALPAAAGMGVAHPQPAPAQPAPAQPARRIPAEPAVTA